MNNNQQNSIHALLASHGTIGAKAAEHKAIHICPPGSCIHHLTIVPQLWNGMTGDDWLNNDWTRNEFCRYLEANIEKEISQHSLELKQTISEYGISYSHEIGYGDLANNIIQVSRHHQFDIIIIGSARPKYISGLKSRVAIKPLLSAIDKPILIVPYPKQTSDE